MEAGGKHLVVRYGLILIGIVTLFFCCLGMLASFLPKRRPTQLTVHGQLLLAFFCQTVLFLPRLLLSNDPAGMLCLIAGLSDHYMWLVGFSWLGALTYEHRPHISNDRSFHIIWFIVLCWVSPLAIIGLNGALSSIEGKSLHHTYGGHFCSLYNMDVFLFSSLLPTAILILLATFFVIASLHSFVKNNLPMPPDADPAEVSLKYRAALSKSLALLILGVFTWSCHLMFTAIKRPFFFYAYVLLVQVTASTLGLLLFVASKQQVQFEKDNDNYSATYPATALSRAQSTDLRNNSIIHLLPDPLATLPHRSASLNLLPIPQKSSMTRINSMPLHQLIDPTGPNQPFMPPTNTLGHQMSATSETHLRNYRSPSIHSNGGML